MSKPSKPQVGIRITPEFQKYHEMMEVEAKREGISVSQLARRIITQYFSESGPSEIGMSEKEKQDIRSEIISEILRSKEFKQIQKELIRETLSEMAKGE